jgi:hypothetical protein
VKNNIFYTGGYAAVDASSETSTAYDYNDYFSSVSGTPFNWGGTAYSFANWKTNSLQDAHSLNVDPKLTSAAAILSGGNYALQTGSPAIDAGVNLGATYQQELLGGDLWPAGVYLFNENNAGPGWEIGGEIYRVGVSTLSLMGCCD